MSTNCNIKNPLQRDGTSQSQRTLKTLLPGYVAVDERSIDELMKFARAYAAEINYYDTDNVVDGNWSGFFEKQIDEKSEYNAPHFVLFMAFLNIFKHAQDDINTITKRHLDFFYRDVLRLTENPAVPDQVYLIFDLAKHVSSCLISKGTQFKAGKDELGNNVVYQLEKEASLNKGKISELKAVFLNKHDIFNTLNPDPKNDYRMYVSPVVNSDDGKGAELTSEDLSWRTFGGVGFPNDGSVPETAVIADRDEAEIGFAFASPNLFLAEGERVVTIYLNLASPAHLLNGLHASFLNKLFRFKFSGEDKWIEPIWKLVTTQCAGELDAKTIQNILDFLNNAPNARAIAGNEPQDGPVFDDPTKGYGDQIRDYDIGMTVARRIIYKRNSLPGRKFTNLDQVYGVTGMGRDKINDLIYTFGDPAHTTIIDKARNRIIIKRTITRDQDPIVAYNKIALLDPFETNWPIVKILINTEENHVPYIYKKLKEIKIESADIMVDVSEVRNLVVQNDQSVLDPGKPFQPFGNRPIIGSNFYIGNREVFRKSLSRLDVNIEWTGLPTETNGFQEHYKNYIPNQPERTNTSFQVLVSMLDKKAWHDIADDTCDLFSEDDGHKLLSGHEIRFTTTWPAGNAPTNHLASIDRYPDLVAFKEYDQASQRGFIRLTLQKTDFGHQEYVKSYTNQVLNAVNSDLVRADGTVTNYTGQLPNEPYTPEIGSLFLNYISSARVEIENVSEDDYDKRIDQFFHVHPTGVGEVDTREDQNFLYPQYNNEGELYIGIDDLDPPQNLSVLFQISEGTSDPDLQPPEISWSYLSGNNWIKFSDDEILSDSTKGLITTGLIEFSVPIDARDSNTILSDGLFWIRASAEKDSFGIPQLIDIRCQAAKAVFVDDNNDPEYLETPLAENTIAKMVRPVSSIKKIEQPFTSFGGAVQERSGDFYTRVSERLRHKNRSISIWDYERIILQNFPSVYKVKCLNHTYYKGTYSSINEAAPGNVSLIIVSNIRNMNAVDPLKPRTSLVTLYDIEELILGLRSPFINVHVFNPLFEEVRVKFNVKFHKGIDQGSYQLKLEEEIIQYLSPWAFESGSDIVFGGTIHKSVILNFVEERHYVDYVTCFEMNHIIPENPENDPEQDVDEAVASTSASVLGSSSGHLITVLSGDDECNCEDNEVLEVENASSNDCPCD